MKNQDGEVGEEGCRDRGRGGGGRGGGPGEAGIKLTTAVLSAWTWRGCRHTSPASPPHGLQTDIGG